MDNGAYRDDQSNSMAIKLEFMVVNYTRLMNDDQCIRKMMKPELFVILGILSIECL